MRGRVFSILAASIVLLASGVTCHLLAKDSEQLDEAAARVAQVSQEVGDWHGRNEATDEQAFAMTGARGFWMRTYVNQKTKESVLAILMCGRPGKMAIHTPEVCYRGAGFELREAPAICTVKDHKEPLAQMWTASFMKPTGEPVRLRLYWGWNSQGEWEASSSPRWQFRGESFLYKLYVSHEITRHPNASAQTDPAAEFLRVFVPALKKTLFES